MLNQQTLEKLHGGQPRSLLQHPSEYLPQGQLAREAGTEGLRQTQTPGHFMNGPDGAELLGSPFGEKPAAVLRFADQDETNGGRCSRVFSEYQAW